MLKLKCDEPRSNSAFKFNLRRYNKDYALRNVKFFQSMQSSVVSIFVSVIVWVLLTLWVGPHRYCSPRHRHACRNLCFLS